MGERAAESAPRGQVERVVALARRRLARISGRRLLRRRGAFVLGAALLVAALRPLLWPLSDEAMLWEGLARSAAFFLSVLALGALALVVVGRRRGPKPLAAARALDEAGGHPEVVASGWAFAEGDHDGPLVGLARARAEEAAAAIDVARAFPLPSLMPGRRKVALFAPAILLGLAIGAYDPVRVAALLDPPTSLETRSAQVLEAAATRFAREAAADAERETEREREAGPRRGRASSEERDSMREMAERARRAADAARRGDRQRALSELGEVGRAGRERSARERALSRTLSRLSQSLEERSGAGSARRASSGDASESLRLLARQTREPSQAEAAEEERQRTLERLSRAAEAMRQEAEQNGSDEASRAAEALRRAAEELSRGDRRAAAEALERAAEQAQQMERAREAAGRQAEALARLMEATGLLERAVQLAMAGREGEGEGQRGMAMGQGDGDGEGEGAAQGGASADEMAALRRALAERLAAMGEGRDGRPAPGPGGHVPDRGGDGREGLDVDHSARARSRVGEGERATQAVRGLGQNGEPTHAYREVFPSYGAIAEEAMTDESIPPLRRQAVRRYFEGIRPGAGEPTPAGEAQEGNEG